MSSAVIITIMITKFSAKSHTFHWNSNVAFGKILEIAR